MFVNHSLGNGRFSTVIRSAAAPSIPDAAPVYHVGDTVMHPSEGVCMIEALRPMDFRGADQRVYYILKPATEKGSSTVYMPVSRGNAVLRRLLAKEDIVALIQRARDHASLWIADSKQRKDAFTRILSDGDYAVIIRMIQEIHENRALRIQEGKKPCASDEAILSEAERLLHQEFSYVLHMSLEETASFICSELGI